MWDAERLRLAADAAGIALWSWNLDTDEMDLDRRSQALCGLPQTGFITLSALSSRVYHEDVDRFRTSLNKTTETPGRYEIDFRIVHPDGIRWISARGEGQANGRVGRTVFAVFLDVTTRKEFEQTRELLVEEMSHRVKNVFQVASALTAISARSAETASDMARDLRQRLLALGNAHDLVRPAPGRHVSGSAFLGPLLTVLLAPYVGTGTMGDRVVIDTPAIGVTTSASAAMALIVHELATNSIKYGALSMPHGTLDVSCCRSDTGITLTWTEAGGPPVTKPARQTGFGSRLIAQCVTRQLQGSITRDWQPAGLVVVLRIGQDCLDE